MPLTMAYDKVQVSKKGCRHALHQKAELRGAMVAKVATVVQLRVAQVHAAMPLACTQAGMPCASLKAVSVNVMMLSCYTVVLLLGGVFRNY